MKIDAKSHFLVFLYEENNKFHVRGDHREHAARLQTFTLYESNNGVREPIFKAAVRDGVVHPDPPAAASKGHPISPQGMPFEILDGLGLTDFYDNGRIPRHDREDFNIRFARRWLGDPDKTTRSAARAFYGSRCWNWVREIAGSDLGADPTAFTAAKIEILHDFVIFHHDWEANPKDEASGNRYASRSLLYCYHAIERELGHNVVQP